MYVYIKVHVSNAQTQALTHQKDKQFSDKDQKGKANSLIYILQIIDMERAPRVSMNRRLIKTLQR